MGCTGRYGTRGGEYVRCSPGFGAEMPGAEDRRRVVVGAAVCSCSLCTLPGICTLRCFCTPWGACKAQSVCALQRLRGAAFARHGALHATGLCTPQAVCASRGSARRGASGVADLCAPRGFCPLQRLRTLARLCALPPFKTRQSRPLLPLLAVQILLRCLLGRVFPLPFSLCPDATTQRVFPSGRTALGPAQR